jgi:LmbE family N-acetylglucosaminyl deacetylase
MEQTVLFLFAHQDDEFGVFQRILDELDTGAKVVCAYLTSGTVGGRSTKERNEESLAVLRRLGVHDDNVLFIGEQLKIDDGTLVHRMDAAANWLKSWVDSCAALFRFYVPAWEGGHPDHDSLHAVGVAVANRAGLLRSARQYSLYNGYKRSGPLFNVMRPLPMNGPIELVPVPWAHRGAFLRHCLSYPTQRKTWIGLFPFVLAHYLVGRGDAVQGVSYERVMSRPHEGPLYYERRKFCTWPELSANVARLMRG